MAAHKNSPRYLVDDPYGMSVPHNFTALHSFLNPLPTLMIADFLALNDMSSSLVASDMHTYIIFVTH